MPLGKLTLVETINCIYFIFSKDNLIKIIRLSWLLNLSSVMKQKGLIFPYIALFSQFIHSLLERRERRKLLYQAANAFEFLVYLKTRIFRWTKYAQYVAFNSRWEVDSTFVKLLFHILCIRNVDERKEKGLYTPRIQNNQGLENLLVQLYCCWYWLSWQ